MARASAPPRRRTLRALHVAAELYPWVKTGGLGDVLAALPPALLAVDLLPLLLVPFTWGALTGLGLAVWAYELPAVRRTGERVLLALVESGMQRDDAYRVVQRLAQTAWDTATPLRELLESEGVPLDYEAVFDYGFYVRFVPEALTRLEVIPSPPS